MAPGVPARARRRRPRRESSDVGDAHAAVGGGEAAGRRGPLRQRDRAPPAGERRRRRGAGRQRRERSRVASTHGWIYQGYLEPLGRHRVARPRRHARRQHLDPGRVPDRAATSRTCSSCRSTGCASAPRRSAAASAASCMVIEPLAAAAALKLRRPVRARADAQRGLRRARTRRRRRAARASRSAAPRDGTLDRRSAARRLRPRHRTRSSASRAISALLTAGPYRWQAHELGAATAS